MPDKTIPTITVKTIPRTLWPVVTAMLLTACGVSNAPLETTPVHHDPAHSPSNDEAVAGLSGCEHDDLSVVEPKLCTIQ